MKNKKIGIMGGTFNPVHNGHIALAEKALSDCSLDEVWFIPSGISYQKMNDNVLPGYQRLEMVRIAIADKKEFLVSDIELTREGNTYTVDTMTFLNATYPEHEFYFIMGADSLYGFPSWKNPEKITKLCKLIVAIRDNIHLKELKKYAGELEKRFHTEIFVISFEKMDISSRYIRSCIKDKIPVNHLIQQKVLDYITENKLYVE